MNRQQRRAQEREKRKYAISKAELNNTVRKSIDRELKEAYQDGLDEGVNQAMILLLTLPLEVLINFYWGADQKKIEKFTSRVLDYYEKWQNDELDMDKLRADLWEYGGVRLQESE